LLPGNPKLQIPNKLKSPNVANGGFLLAFVLWICLGFVIYCGVVADSHLQSSSAMSQKWKVVLPLLCVAAVLPVAAGAFFATTHVLAVRAWDRGGFPMPDHDPSLIERVVAEVMDYAINSTESNDVIAIGDSTCLFGFMAEVFTQRTGLRAHNLGLVAPLGVSAYRVCLERYLDHHPKPKLILLCVSPAPAGFAISHRSRYVPMREQFFSCYERGHPSSWRREAMVGVRALLLTTVGSRAEDSRQTQAAAAEARAWQTDGPRSRPAESRPSVRPLPPLTFDAETRDDLKQLVRAAEGIPVAIAFTPVASPIGNLPQLHADLAEMGFITTAAVAHVYDPEIFWDEFMHLDFRGAVRFTEFLADSFRGGLAEPQGSQIVHARENAQALPPKPE
jgi:hypothetical protein